MAHKTGVVEKRGKFESSVKRESGQGRVTESNTELNLLFISEHAIYGRDWKDFPPKILGQADKHTHDVKLCANFKFMHGKFAHAVKINDAAARKFLSCPVLGQLVDASDLLLASFVCQPHCLPAPPAFLVTAIDNNRAHRQLAAVRFGLWL